MFDRFGYNGEYNWEIEPYRNFDDHRGNQYRYDDRYNNDRVEYSKVYQRLPFNKNYDIRENHFEKLENTTNTILKTLSYQ